VRVHPETGRKSLFLTERIEQFVDMTTEESRPLLQFLLEHATRPQFCYRHVWQRDDLLMWDNRCTLHLAVLDYDKSQVRQMDKTAIEGTACGGYRYEAAAH
jgi:taurine dioxygenase